MFTPSTIPVSIAKAIVSEAQSSRRGARDLCNQLGWGGGSGDLSKVLLMIQSREDIGPLPSPDTVTHGRFIFGDDSGRRSYVVHTREPRFIAEHFDFDDPILDGFDSDGMYDLGEGEVIANVVWIDSPPDRETLAAIFHDLIAELAEYDFRAEVTEERRKLRPEDYD